MYITSMDSTRYRTQTISDEPDGKYVIGNPDATKDVIWLVGKSTGWAVECCPGSTFKNKPSDDLLKNGSLFKVYYNNGNAKVYFFVEKQTADRQMYTRYRVPKGKVVTIGSNSDNDIVCQQIGIPHHLISMYSQADGRWKVSLNSTTVPVYVNSRFFTGGILNHGDVIWVMGQKIIVMPDILALNNPDQKTVIRNDQLTQLTAPKIPRDSLYIKSDKREYFNRSPRLVKSWKMDDISVDAPPGVAGDGQDSNLLMSLAPSLTNGLLSLVSGFGSIFTIGSMVTNMIFPSINRKKMQQQQAEYVEKQRNAYRDYLNEINQKIDQKFREQAEQLRNVIPSATEEANRILRDKKYLWNRRPEQEDCFVVRLGIGDLPLECKVTLPQEHFSVDRNPLLEMLDEVRNRELTVRNVPVSIDLTKIRCCGIVGSKADRYALLTNVLTQLALHVGYDEMKFWFIGKVEGKLKYYTRLPHTWDDERQYHFVPENEDELADLTQAMTNVLKQREANANGASSTNSDQLVIVITDPAMLNSGSLMSLLFDCHYDQTSILVLGEHTADLPRFCDSVIGVHGTDCILKRNDEEKMPFHTDSDTTEFVHRLSYIMENTILNIYITKQKIPNVVPFMSLFDVQDVDYLNISNRWHKNEASRSLKAPIGIDENGKLCELDVHEKANGAHGLIAGMTGSGKSELLMTYILSMAVSYSPDEVAFVLIDYKGGGMAQTFRDLPHVAGIITNLDGASIDRALKSISSEMVRRQRIFSDVQARLNIPKMEMTQYQQLYRNGKVSEPLPHLIIITDEFAELKSQQSEFMQELISVSNIGRSLGVHLILSTQKPSGVVDEKIWSNSKFKICLHVESTHDSNEMIKVPDAAMLSATGRFLFDPGYGTLIQAQSAWTGAIYNPAHTESSMNYVNVIDHTGDVLYHSTMDNSSSSQTKRLRVQLEVVKEKISEIAQAKKNFARPLWLPMLEALIQLRELRQKYPYTNQPGCISALLGEADCPETQSRRPVRLALNEGRHTLIYGMVGSGKAMALKTLLYDLTLQYTPDDVWVYIVDCIGEGFEIYKSAPQVGDVVMLQEKEKLGRLMLSLETELETRISNAARRTQVGKSQPTILLMIHQLNAFLSSMDASDDRLTKLLDNGPQYGIYIIATAQTTTGITYSMQNKFAQTLVLQMANDDDYSSVFSDIRSFRPSQVYGRGIVSLDKCYYEFQVATPDDNPEREFQEAKAKWNGRLPFEIPTMPDILTGMYMMRYAQTDHLLRIPVALEETTLKPVYLDGEQRRVWQIIGPLDDTSRFAGAVARISMSMGMKVSVLDCTERFKAAPECDVYTQQEWTKFIDEYYDRMISLGNNITTDKVQHQLVILIGISKILRILSEITKTMDGLSNDYASILKIFLCRVNVKFDWHTTFIVCDDANGMQLCDQTIGDKGQGAKWYKEQVGHENGFILNRDPDKAVNIFHDANIRGLRILRKEDFPSGIAVIDGKAMRVKYVEPRTTES